MGTATEHEPHAAYGTPGASHKAEPVDPEHDIDAKSTTIWVVASSIVLFIGLYFMLPLFDLVLQVERTRKIDSRPAIEKQDVLEAERQFLRGEESSTKKSIEQVMAEMVRDHGK